MDAISYLKQEHVEIKKLLAAVDKAADIKTKKAKFNVLCNELIRHETMEQKAWYPTLKQVAELKKIIGHLVEEERSAAKAIKKFKKLQFDFIWKLRFYKFKHDVLHHAKEEEQALFPKVKEVLNKSQLNILGTRMKKFKASLKAKK